jgi:hypothetical protein
MYVDFRALKRAAPLKLFVGHVRGVVVIAISAR